MIRDIRTSPLWCILQADADRLCPTSRGPVPNQYWSAPGGVSLIQQSLHRALGIAKPRQIIATVAAGHRNWWSAPLWCVPERRRVVDESGGRPTVTLATAMALIERETGGDALLVVQPAETAFACESAFTQGLDRALRALETLPHHVIALTLEAYRHEPDQDYLLLGAADESPGRSAVRFTKRPAPMIAEQLIKLGAYRSTGVYVARLSTLTGIIAELWPDLMASARSLAWTTAGEVRTPARMPGSQFLRPWRHTWIQRPIPRLRAVAVDDFESPWGAEGASMGLRTFGMRTDTHHLAGFSPPIS